MTETLCERAEPVPLHGYRGDVGRGRCRPVARAGLTIAVSREAGARGGSIAQRVGRKLGWQVVDQELLEFLAQDETAFQELPAAAREWADERLDQLLRSRVLSQRARHVIGLARTVLLLGSQGEVVLVGRGAGYLLPPATTLHVRVVAPEDRPHRLHEPVAAADGGRGGRGSVRRGRPAGRVPRQCTCGRRRTTRYPYDFVLNSEPARRRASAELIAQAARGKLLGLEPGPAEVAPRLPEPPGDPNVGRV